jgi:hypothetical protein
MRRIPRKILSAFYHKNFIKHINESLIKSIDNVMAYVTIVTNLVTKE